MLAILLGIILIFVVLWDAFETIILPRRVTRRWRLTRLFYLYTWRPWAALARRVHDTSRRESFLSVFGPLSLLLLLITWAVLLVIGYGLIQWGLGSHLTVPFGHPTLGTDLYMSGTTFTTLGLGDIAPRTTWARFFTVLEAGTGFGFLALVIGYLPVLYQAFSQREVDISRLDARAGSPPSGVELIRRYGRDRCLDSLGPLLQEWEKWSAEVLESHLSYPSVAFFRSQHDNQSWVASLTAILDACAIVMAGIDGVPLGPARLTYAMARHAAVDMCQVLGVSPREPDTSRVSPADLAQARVMLAEAGVSFRAGEEVDQRLNKLHAFYEPYVTGLSESLLLPLPPWLPTPDAEDDWKSTAWERVHHDVTPPGLD